MTDALSDDMETSIWTLIIASADGLGKEIMFRHSLREKDGTLTVNVETPFRHRDVLEKARGYLRQVKLEKVSMSPANKNWLRLSVDIPMEKEWFSQLKSAVKLAEHTKCARKDIESTPDGASARAHLLIRGDRKPMPRA